MQLTRESVQKGKDKTTTKTVMEFTYISALLRILTIKPLRFLQMIHNHFQTASQQSHESTPSHFEQPHSSSWPRQEPHLVVLRGKKYGWQLYHPVILHTDHLSERELKRDPGLLQTPDYSFDEQIRCNHFLKRPFVFQSYLSRSFPAANGCVRHFI